MFFKQGIVVKMNSLLFFLVVSLYMLQEGFVVAGGPLTLVTDDPKPGSLKECEGDCDNDSECQPGLICMQRKGTEAVPGCAGTSYPGTDFCYKKPSAGAPVPKPVPKPVPVKQPPGKALGFKGSNGAVGLLDTCQGDCNNDNECMAGLKCKERKSNETIPGCYGDKKEWTGFDFCYKATFALKFISQNRGPFPFNACEGDCDRDNDCKNGLKCYRREKQEPIPGCTGDKKEWSGVDFCYKP